MSFRNRCHAVICILPVISALLLAGEAAAFVSPQHQEDYAIPLSAFDLSAYDSPAMGVAKAEAARAFTARNGGEWRVHTWNPQTNTPHFLYGSGIQVAGPINNSDQAIAAAMSAVRANLEVLGADPANLRLDSAPSGMGKQSVLFQQVYHGIDVFGGQVRLTFTEQGRLFVVGSDYYRDIRVNPTPSVSAEVAKEIAIGALPPYDRTTDSVEGEAKLLILPVPLSETQVDHHLVWRIRVHVSQPVGIWVTFVDAHDGEVIWRYNDVHFLDYTGNTSGMIQRPSYCEGQQPEVLPYLRVQVSGLGPVYADVNGNWTVPYAGTDSRTVTCDLYSPYVDLNNVGGAEGAFAATAAPGTPLTVTFDDANSQKDEKDVYRTINDIHDFYQDIHAEFGYINARITANVSLSEACNAFWNGSINFYRAGGGCGNTGEIMSVIQHEFCHGITHSILGGQGDEGIGEGNSDILANLMTLESIMGRGFGLDACATGIRDADNTLRYPEDVVGREIHYAGQVIAGFHWDVLEALIAQYGVDEGRHIATMIWHFGRFLEHPTNQRDQVLATFIADDDDGDLTNGVPHYDALCQAAYNHGFDCPELLVGVFINYEPISSRTQAGDVPITAQIYSTEGALLPDSARVRYRVNGGPFAWVAMQPTGGLDEFEGTIPGLAPLDEVEYYIRARDSAGYARSTPNHAPYDLHSFDIATTFDDLEIATGWTVNLEGTDNATSGIWVRADPIGTMSGGEQVQPEDDYTHSPGTVCWVTGNGTPGGPPEASDVSGGRTTVYSPVYDLAGCELAKVKYWRWYTNNLGANPDQDAWKVQVRNNGGTWRDLEYTIVSANLWGLYSFDLIPIFGAEIGQVQFKFLAADVGPASLVEAGVDDFELMVRYSADAPDAAAGTDRFALLGSQPNPIRKSAEFAFQLPSAATVRLSLYDVSGRLVRDLAAGTYDPGVHRVHWDGLDAKGNEVSPGVYYCRIAANEFRATRAVVLTR